MKEAPAITMYTVYDRPRDYPYKVVVRAWHAGGGRVDPEQQALTFSTLAEARAHLAAKGLFNLGRDPSDDPKIVETWI